jgi:tetratricopeptide (TPR) repeat protein
MRAAALLVAATLAAGPASADLVLTPEALRAAAQLALAQGEAGRAADYAAALLQRDPQDGAALIVQSQALRDLGRYDAAQDAARAAWTQAGSTAARHEAAMAMAQALASDGQRMAAQYWLRRAVQTAPDDAARGQAEADFGYVRSRMPLILRFDVSVAPSSNVNNGTSAQTMQILGLPFTISGDAQALSGIEATLGLAATWRLPPRDRSATQLTLALQTQQVALSDEAKAIAPDARGSDYAFAAYELGLTHQWVASGAPLLGALDLAVGHNDYGGAPLSNYLQARIAAEVPVDPRTTALLSADGERQWRLDLASRSAVVLGLTAGLALVLGNGDQIALTLGHQQINSASVEIDHAEINGRLGWQKARPVGGVGLEAALQIDALDYPVSPYTDSGRQDLAVTGLLSATLLEVGYMGFNPVIRLVASRNSSNVDLYDQRNVGISFGIASAF